MLNGGWDPNTNTLLYLWCEDLILSHQRNTHPHTKTTGKMLFKHLVNEILPHKKLILHKTQQNLLKLNLSGSRCMYKQDLSILFTYGLLVFLSWLHVFSSVSSPSEEQLLSARHAGSLCTCPCFSKDSPLLTQTCVITQQRIRAPASTLPPPLASLPLQF